MASLRKRGLTFVSTTEAMSVRAWSFFPPSTRAQPSGQWRRKVSAPKRESSTAGSKPPIIMAVFDVTQQVVANSSGIISGNTRVNDIGLSMLQSSMMQMDVGPLFGLFLQSFFIGITMRILSIVIFVIVYGRMIEIYMMVSLAPVPMATWGNHEQSHVGQNYLRSLFALGFQGFLILICVAIYAVLLQNVAISGDAINSIWSIVGYTVLLCFTLFKTGSVARSILGAH